MNELEIPYTGYCTCFKYIDEVIFYDEIKEKKIKIVKATGEEAEKLMNEWVDNAPGDVICQKL